MDGTLKDCFPLQTSVFQSFSGSRLVLSRVERAVLDFRGECKNASPMECRVCEYLPHVTKGSASPDDERFPSIS